MKNIFLLIPIAFAVLSCNNHQAPAPETIAPMTAKEPLKEKFKASDVDNKTDFVCGMPTTAAISDTVHYKGKVYGFCSEGCKDDFKKDPSQYLSKK